MKKNLFFLLAIIIFFYTSCQNDVEITKSNLENTERALNQMQSVQNKAITDLYKTF